MLVYTWLDPQRMSYGFGYGSFLVPGWTRPCFSGGHLCHRFASAAEPAAGRHSPHHIVHNIRSRGRLGHWLTLFVAVVLHRHTHIHTTCSCRAWDLHRPGTATSAPSAPGIGGPSCTYGYAWQSGRTRRDCYVQPDGNGARPSAVVLLMVAGRGGHCLHCPWIGNYVIYHTIRSMFIHHLLAQFYIQ